MLKRFLNILSILSLLLFLLYLWELVLQPNKNQDIGLSRQHHPLEIRAQGPGVSVSYPQIEDQSSVTYGAQSLIYIAIEGIEYSGKTEIVSALKRELESRNYKVKTYDDYFPKDKEPDSQIRFLSYLLNHVRVSKKIKEDIKSKNIDYVITERSFISPLVYEMFMQHESRDKIDLTEEFLYEILELKDQMPKTIYYIDISPQTAYEIGMAHGNDELSLEELTQIKVCYKSILAEIRQVFHVTIKPIKWNIDVRFMIKEILNDIL
jgi:thymidylate kinase